LVWQDGGHSLRKEDGRGRLLTDSYEISDKEIAALHFLYGLEICDHALFNNTFKTFENFVKRIAKEQMEKKNGKSD